jgi:hypothetical protein
MNPKSYQNLAQFFQITIEIWKQWGLSLARKTKDTEFLSVMLKHLKQIN